MSRDLRQAQQNLRRARRGLFVALSLMVLVMPLGASVESVYSYSDLAPGPQLYTALSTSFAMDGFLPSLGVAAALAILFPRWRVVRVALPLVTALMLIVWAAWMWVFFGPVGKFPDFPPFAMRWSLVAAGPLGVVAAATLVFLWARTRRPATTSPE